jgi:uncharacterized protein YkwD
MKKSLRLFGFITIFIGLLTSTQPAQAAGVIGPAVSNSDPPGPVLQYSGCNGEVVPAFNAAYEQRVVELVNQERAKVGLPPLKRSENLTKAARYYSADMNQDDYFGVKGSEHDTFDRVNGKLVETCGVWERIAVYYSGASGENIAAGYPTPEAVMDAWMNSPGHKANILSQYNWEVGTGFYQGESGYYFSYWAQDFGRQSDSYPLIIDREAAQTDNRDVSLYIYGDWQEMRLRNDNDSPTSWSTFQPQVNWTLNPGSGSHTVTVELRNGSKTASSSDTIYLTSDDPVLGSVPDTLHFLYSIPDKKLYPPDQAFIPQNIGNGDTLTWQVTSAGSFFDVDPGIGTTPASIRVTPDNFNQNKSTTYTGEITIKVTNPTSVQGSPKTTQITLEVVDYAVHQIFLPGIQN